MDDANEMLPLSFICQQILCESRRVTYPRVHQRYLSLSGIKALLNNGKR